MKKYLVVVYNYDRCEPRHYEETRRDREWVSFIYSDALTAACSIVRETIRNARIQC